MDRNVAIYGLKPETRLRLKILAAGHGVTMSRFLDDLIEGEWKGDKTPATKEAKRKIKRILKRFGEPL